MAITRPLKEGSVTTYQAKVAAGFPDILASEMDADLDTIYAAWNGGVGTANLGDGSVTYAKLAPDAQLWRDTGTTLTLGTNFTTRPVLVQSGAVAVQNAAAGSAVKTRVLMHTNQNGYLTSNFDVAGTAQDDATKPSWMVNLGSTGADTLRIRRAPPGSVTFSDLLTLDTTGQLYLTSPGVTSRAHVLQHTNANLYIGTNFNVAAGAIDDATQPSWLVQFGTTAGDTLQVRRGAPGATTLLTPLSLDATGNLTITGATATKASGTTWANPSDPRLKDDVAPYARGVREILALEPITYRLKAEPDGPTCYGFDAAQVRDVFPECISEVRMKLDPNDDEETDGVLSFDMHPILVALVNAVKELAARVDAR